MENGQADGNGARDTASAFGQAMEMMRMINEMSGANAMGEWAGRPRCEGRPPGPPGFSGGGWPELDLLRAVMPYMEPEFQRKAGLLIKLAELRELMEGHSSRLMSISSAQGEDWRAGMLQAVRAYMPEEKQRVIDTLLNALRVKELMENMQGQGSC